MRLAAVDIGTNSTRLLVADVQDGQVTTEQARAMVITRLGRGVDATRRFDPAALARTLEVVGGYADRCQQLGVEAVRVVATSATRDVRNRDELVAGVLTRTGVEPEVLSGEQEAAATWAGATADLPGAERTLVVDIGGGSTEFIVGVPDRPASVPEAMASLDIGCVRLTERFLSTGGLPLGSRGAPATSVPASLLSPPDPLHTDPPAPAAVAAMRAEVRAQLARLDGVLDPAAASRVVGVAGTVTTVVALALGLPAYDPRVIHHATVEAGQVEATTARLLAMTVAERAALPVMAPGREDVIAAGAVVLDEVCRTFGFARIVASEADILDGVLLGLAATAGGGARPRG